MQKSKKVLWISWLGYLGALLSVSASASELEREESFFEDLTTIDYEYLAASYIVRSVKDDERSRGDVTARGGEITGAINFTHYFFITGSYRHLNLDYDRSFIVESIADVNDARLQTLSAGLGLKTELLGPYLGVRGVAELMAVRAEFLNGTEQHNKDKETEERFEAGFYGDIFDVLHWQLHYSHSNNVLFKEADAELKVVYYGTRGVNLVLGYSHGLQDAAEDSQQYLLGFDLTF